MSPEELFAKCVEKASKPMQPRSRDDKEYFAQDWLRDRFDELGYSYKISGRNTYPDFWLGQGDHVFGIEVKSLAFANGRPARRDFDSNSTIPGGEKQGKPIYVAFFLYTGSGEDSRAIHSLCLFHGDLLNAERQFIHENKAIHNFGSYGDAFIRDRKMYVFKTPFTLKPDLLGEFRLVVPSNAQLTRTDPPLRKLDTVQREWVEDRVIGYRIDLVTNEAIPETERAPKAGEVVTFDVWGADVPS